MVNITVNILPHHLFCDNKTMYEKTATMERTGYVVKRFAGSSTVAPSVTHLYLDQGDPSVHFHCIH